MKRITCEYNVDTACVELRRGNTVILAVDCIAVEDTVPRNLYERSALDWLVYNAPLEYLELVLSGEIWDYLRKYTDYRSRTLAVYVMDKRGFLWYDGFRQS